MKSEKYEFTEIPDNVGFTDEQIRFIHSVGADAGRAEAQKKFDDYFTSMMVAIKDIPGNTRDEIKKDLDPINTAIIDLRRDNKAITNRLNKHENWLWGLSGAAAIIIIMIIIIFV